jgi:hypothetical protein
MRDHGVEKFPDMRLRNRPQEQLSDMFNAYSAPFVSLHRKSLTMFPAGRSEWPFLTIE